MNLMYDGTNLKDIQSSLGKRGNYTIDPWYIRAIGPGNNRRVYFWDHYKKKWAIIRVGDMFTKDRDGIPRKNGN